MSSYVPRLSASYLLWVPQAKAEATASAERSRVTIKNLTETSNPRMTLAHRVVALILDLQ